MPERVGIAGEVMFPEEYQKITSVKLGKEVWGLFSRADLMFGLGSRSGLTLVGRYPIEDGWGYVVYARDAGNIVFIISEEEADRAGFHPEDFNFEDQEKLPKKQR